MTIYRALVRSSSVFQYAAGLLRHPLLKTLAKIALSCLWAYLVLQKVDAQVIGQSLAQLHAGWVTIAFIVFHLSRLAAAFRLQFFFNQIDLILSFALQCKLYYLGMFYNLFLPGGISGDAYKVYLLNKHYQTSISDLLRATLCDRVSGLFALAWLGIASAGMGDLLQILHGFVPALATAFLLIPLSFACNWMFDERFTSIYLKTILGALLVQLLQGLSALCLFMALSVQGNLWACLVIFYISSVVSVLPISFGGVGAREWTVYHMAPIVGLDPQIAVCGSMLFFLLQAISSIPGVFYLDAAFLLPTSATNLNVD